MIIDELNNAVERVKERRKSNFPFDNLSDLFSNLKGERPKKLAISSTYGKEYLEIKEILRLEASGSYTNIYLLDNRKIVASKKLKDFEEILSDYHFFRVHNSHIVNLHEVVKYINSNGGWIIMKGNVEVPLARRKRNLFDLMMNKINSKSKIK